MCKNLLHSRNKIHATNKQIHPFWCDAFISGAERKSLQQNKARTGVVQLKPPRLEEQKKKKTEQARLLLPRPRRERNNIRFGLLFVCLRIRISEKSHELLQLGP